MPTKLRRRDLAQVAGSAALAMSTAPAQATAQSRPRRAGQQMTDDERFAMISVIGAVGVVGGVRDERIPVPTCPSSTLVRRQREADAAARLRAGRARARRIPPE